MPSLPRIGLRRWGRSTGVPFWSAWSLVTAGVLALGLLSVLAGGCGGGDPDGLWVIGSLAVEGADVETGFAFEGKTRLGDDRLATGDRLSGHCTIGHGGGDGGGATAEAALSVAIVRSAAPDEAGQGISEVEVRVDTDVENPQGLVTAKLGATDVYADLMADCAMESLLIDRAGAMASIVGQCTLRSTDGATELTASLDLTYGGCSSP